jgi:hypothetical protein
MADPFRQLLANPVVDIRDPATVELWTRTLDVYTAELVHAVEHAGTSSAAVLEYLRGKRDGLK